jgi:hydroxypyruvate isomerase
MNRRNVLALGGAMTGLLVGSPFASLLAAPKGKGKRVVKKGRLKQSVSRWCYDDIALDDLCRAAADMGLVAVDLLDEKEWDVPRKYGLTCSMGYAGGGSIPDGLNDKAHHAAIEKGFREKIPLAVKAGVPNVITFFGNRKGRKDQEALDNCVAGLNRVKNIAEDAGVTVCIELLNSKVDHADYHGDKTAFGLQVVKAVNSPRVRLLYDIYHMQIMEGDVIRTIRDNHQWIAHYHTGGVPGRHELDETQELNWAAVCRAILDTGFTGYVAHEFVPINKKDPLASLRAAASLCDV